jgi:Zinc knuckle
MADLARWLGCDPRQVARTDREANQSRHKISRNDRAALDERGRMKLMASAQEGLENKFSIMEPFDKNAKLTKEQLKGVYSVQLRVEELRYSLQEYDMLDVFTIPSRLVYEEGEGRWVPAQGARQIDLFTSHQDVSLDTIRKTMQFKKLWAEEQWVVDNMIWSGQKILNSCDDKLRQKIEEQLMGIGGRTFEYHTGPYYFKMMMDLVQANSTATIRTLSRNLETLNLKDFDGESVLEYTSIMRGVIEMLNNNDTTPHDAVYLICEALKQCSTPDFVDFIKNTYFAHQSGINPILPEDLLSKAEIEYTEMSAQSKWEKGIDSKGQDSVFSADSRTCYNCGKVGHLRANCPEPPKQSNTGGRGRGRGGRGGRGDRGGRGGHGRGNSGGRGTAEKDPNRMPPKPGEAHVKPDGKKWCGHCTHWGDHDTAQHRAMLAGSGNGGGKDADQASTAASPTKNEQGAVASTLLGSLEIFNGPLQDSVILEQMAYSPTAAR